MTYATLLRCLFLIRTRGSTKGAVGAASEDATTRISFVASDWDRVPGPPSNLHRRVVGIGNHRAVAPYGLANLPGPLVIRATDPIAAARVASIACDRYCLAGYAH